MQAALYHFLPDPDPVLARMLAAAGRGVIVAEPIRNLATSRSAPVRWIGRRAVGTIAGPHPQRFTADTLERAVERTGARVVRRLTTPGRR